jgi:thiopeptide-type bacteriocin biosynthesis protein
VIGDAMLRRRFEALDPVRQARFLGVPLHKLRCPAPQAANGWVQANVTLQGTPEAYRGFLAAAFDANFERLRIDGQATAFFFMHKPPGLRLRLHGNQRQLTAVLSERLVRLQADGCIQRHVFDFYEPETALFGGPTGMAFAHQFFTADSLAVLGYFRDACDGAPAMRPQMASTAVLDILLRSVLGDAFELWDVWNGVKDLRGDSVPLSAGDERAALAGLALSRSLPAAPAEPAWLVRYRADLDALGAAIAAVRAEAGLGFPLRRVLQFWVLFHWNRMGFDVRTQGALAARMATLLAPGVAHRER